MHFLRRSRSSKRKSQPRGFTMIELLVVATIMAVLAAVGLVSYQSAARNGRNGKRKADLETVRSALVLYRTDTGAYPTGNGTNSAFNSAVTTLDNNDYLSTGTVSDPKNVSPYVYTYESDGVTFTLCANLEPEPVTQYCIDNP
jgi:prepilin-type N-terminal cleavage/methylation domain-containing protein